MKGEIKPKLIFTQTGLNYKPASRDYRRVVNRAQRKSKNIEFEKLSRSAAKMNVMLERFRSKEHSLQSYKLQAINANEELKNTQERLHQLQSRYVLLCHVVLIVC